MENLGELLKDILGLGKVKARRMCFNDLQLTMPEARKLHSYYLTCQALEKELRKMGDKDWVSIDKEVNPEGEILIMIERPSIRYIRRSWLPREVFSYFEGLIPKSNSYVPVA